MGEERAATGLQEAAGGRGLLTLTPARLAQITRPGSIHDAYVVEQLPFARGQFASVRKCTCRSTGRRFAAKVLRRRRRLADIQHEIAVLDAFSDEQHIVQLHEVYQTTTEIILILQMAAGGELQTVLDVEEFLEERAALRLIYQLLLALRPLHQNHIAHLDIKPQNVLLSGPLPEGRVKLCDFGISRCVSAGRELREIMGTPDYMAPEMLNYEPLSLATDMWSVGVLTYALLSGYTPFSGSSTQETYCNITSMPLDFPEQLFSHVSQTVRNFIAGLLVKNPNERRTLEECLNHPCMTDMVLSVSGTRPTASSLGLKEVSEARSGDQGLRGCSPADSGFSSPVSSDDEGAASRLSPLPQLPDPLPQLYKSTTASPRGTSTPSTRGTPTPRPRGTSTSRLQMRATPASPQLPKKTFEVVGHVTEAHTRGRKTKTCPDRSSSVPPLKRCGAEVQRRLSPRERAADPPVSTKRSEKAVCTGVRARAQANLLLLARDDPLNVLPLASSSSTTAGPRARHKLACHLPSRK